MLTVKDPRGNFKVTNEYDASVWGGGTDIGKAKSLEDALAIIKSHSGHDIEKIE